jgi:hypothetical protein
VKLRPTNLKLLQDIWETGRNGEHLGKQGAGRGEEREREREREREALKIWSTSEPLSFTSADT